jgi:general secretion pathway protein G
MKNQERAKVDNGKECTLVATVVVATEKSKTPYCSKGFTLVELIIVVAIVGVLATLAIPAYDAIREKARIYRAVAEIRNLETEINAYLTEKGVYPATLSDLGRGVILDPWEHEYQYSPVPKYKDRFLNLLNTTYDLHSMGSGGTSNLGNPRTTDPACKDDVILGGDGSYIGTGENYEKL